MPRALEALDATLRSVEQGKLSALAALEQLLGEELTMRETRRIKIALMTARLGSLKTLDGFDFSFQPSLDRNRILALAELAFIARKEIVHLLGRQEPARPRLRRSASKGGQRPARSVCLAPWPTSSLRWPRRARRPAQERIRFIARNALLIVDEMFICRSPPVAPACSSARQRPIRTRRQSLTSNRGFGEWGDIFGDQVVATALLDRLLHHAQVGQIEGSSYRLREHAALVPDNLKATHAGTLSPQPPRLRRGRPRKEPQPQ
jgi:DNA replication protein DnaC